MARGIEGMRRYLLFRRNSVGMGELAVCLWHCDCSNATEMGKVVNLIVVLFFLRHRVLVVIA